MSLPSAAERRLLDQVADDLRETFAERGHKVDVALDADPAFGSGMTCSSLRRDLVLHVLELSASRLGLSFRAVNGAGRELVGERHRFRILQAKRNTNGQLVVLVSSDSALIQEEDESLFPMESWVLCWVRGADGLIAEVFAAKIVGYRPGRPNRLKLGEMLTLGSGEPLDGGFTPADEDLDVFDDDDEDAGDVGA